MTDREKLIEVLTDLEKEDEFICDGCVRANKPICIESLANRLITHGVTVREMQKPLPFEEAFDRPDEVWLDEKVIPWLRNVDAVLSGFSGFCELYYIGHEMPLYKEIETYGKEWRLWEEKPTEEERRAAEWL